MFKTQIYIYGVLAMFFLSPTMISACEHGVFKGGNGTVNAPYQISSSEEYVHIKEHNTEGYYFLQTQDFTTNAYLNGDFYGTYDGGGYQIIQKDHWGTSNSLFPKNYGTIKNLVFDEKYPPLLTLFNYGTIENCVYKSGQVTGWYGTYGKSIFTHENYGAIKNCKNNGTMINSGSTGAVFAMNNYGEIIGCSNTASTRAAAGIAYENKEGGVIKNCYNSGTLRVEQGAGGRSMAGIVHYNYGEIINCYNTGAMIGYFSEKNTIDIGGIALYNYGSIKNSYYIHNDTTTSFATNYTPRLNGTIARNRIHQTTKQQGTVTNCYYSNISDSGVEYDEGKTGISKTLEEMKTPEMVTILNNSQKPIAWIKGSSIHPYPELLGKIDLQLNASQMKIGDNTKLNMTLAGGIAGTVKIRDTRTNDNIYIGGYSPTMSIEIPYAGEISLIADFYLDDVYMTSSNIIIIDKQLVLNNIIKIIQLTSSETSKVVIVNESHRYFEDNSQNRGLIDKIKSFNVGVYMIGNGISPIFNPLYEIS